MGRNRISLFSIFTAALFSMATPASATTVVLQNGLNGYTGFQDTYIENVAATTHGADTVLQSWCG